MSTASAIRAQGSPLALAPARERWLYWLVFPGGAEWMDAAVRHVLAPAATALREHDAVGRWFYLRYVEERGPHLRLRARVAPGAIDAVDRAVGAILRERLRSLHEARPGRAALLLDRAAPLASGGRHRGLHRALYQPELDKFGGPAGVELAERVFEASSELALEAVGALARPLDRAGLAIALMRELEALLPAGARAGLWSRYADVWSGAGRPGRAGVRDRLARAAERLRPDLPVAGALPAGETPLAAAAATYQAGLADVLAEAARRRIASPFELAFHHMHLTDNRLGLAPIEEALLAMTLASAQRDA